ncbi:MAG TPA: hypothetical protein VIF37_14265 [Methylobacter sp.]
MNESIGGEIKSVAVSESKGINTARHPGRDCRDPDAMDGNFYQAEE